MEPRYFRDVLGHFPTGVVIVTAIGVDGEPVGMAVGSFTSVSLEPPLIAFLPDKSSSTFPRIREAASFCINVLSAAQEPVCRAFARRGEDKYAGVEWRPAPSGAPILEGVVAWLDCELDVVHEAGDHFIVLGRVNHLQVENPTLPLLFFQGGYGAFALRSVVIGAREGLAEQVILADRARDDMEQLARATGIEVQAFAPTEDSLMLVASATPNAESTPSRVGIHLPFVPPAGRLFAAWEGPDVVQAWYDRSPAPLDPEHIAEMDRHLESAREHRWIPTLHSAELDDVWLTIGRIAALGQTPGLVRHLSQTVTQLGGHSDPASIVDDESAGQVQALSAAVFGPNGKVVLMLTAIGIPEGSSLERVLAIKDKLMAAAGKVTASIGGILPVSPDQG